MVDVETNRHAGSTTRSMYRKVFEKEVEFLRIPSLSGEGKSLQLKATLPIIRDKESLAGKKHGLLTMEQKRWTVALPNDSKTGNPVYKRHEKLSSLHHAKLTSNQLRSLEVRGLPDQVASTSSGSDVVERIQTSRKQRHEATLEDMHQELSMLATEVEVHIDESCQLLKENLEANDKEISRLFEQIGDDEVLVRYTMPQLTGLWNTVTKQAPVRRQWISELDTMLERMEKERTNMISDILKAYSERLETISFLLPADIHRLIASEVLTLNVALLSNRGSYAELYSKLMTADVERERHQHNIWVNRLTDWKVLNCELAQHMFAEFMNSPAILNPSEVEKLLSLLSAEQQAVNRRRLELIGKMSKAKPPAIKKPFVYGWNVSVKSIQQELESLHGKYVGAFEDAQAAVNARCIDEMERCRVALLESGVCSEQTVYDVINQGFLPMVEQRERHATNLLEEIKKSLETAMAFQDSQLQSLFQFAQGAAHLWDEHQVAMTEQEVALKMELDKSRQNYDAVNKCLEADLDLVLDRMRQDASEETLAASLKEALTVLDKIKEGYFVFHDEVVNKAAVYPSIIQTVLVAYDSAVLKYFSVDRKPHVKSKRKAQRGKGKASDGRATVMGGRHSVLSSLSHKDTGTSEVLCTSGGTTFFVLSDPGEHGLGPSSSAGSVFLTESEATKQPTYAWTENLMIPEGTFMETRKSMRIAFLEHMEEFKLKATDASNDVVKTKKEEASSELDLKLHIHSLRPARAETDIHNVRASELLMHRERIQRHAQGVSNALSGQKAHYVVLCDAQRLLSTRFCDAVQEMMETVQTADKTHKLVAIQKELRGSVSEHLSSIRSSLISYRSGLDKALNELRDSNTKFSQSLKTFSDGGNFCPAEVEEFSRRLEKVSGRIDSVEKTLLVDVDGLEKKLVSTATLAVKQWEDKFRHHLSDMAFVEKVSRWLTNIQVKIKSEVAASNSQTQQLVVSIDQLERHCDAVESPSPDKEQLTAQQLFASLPDIFTRCKNRVTYLDCSAIKQSLRTEARTELLKNTETAFQGRPAVSFEELNATGRVSVSGRGSRAELPLQSLAQEPLSAINLTKSILRHTQSKRQQQVSIGQQSDATQSMTSMPRPPPSMDLSAKMMSLSVPGELDKNKSGKSSATGRRKVISSKKSEKKYESFGEEEDDNAESFMPRTRKILVDGRDSLFSVCELFYRQKGGRVLTRPELIHDSLDQCTDALNMRLQSYRAQAESYRNSCIQEFTDQLARLSAALVRVPPVTFKEMLTEELSQMDKRLKEIDDQHDQRIEGLNKRKAVHESELRVVLGHPSNSDKLTDLSTEEIGRVDEMVEAVKQHSSTLQTCLVNLGQSFLSHISQLSEKSLLTFDSITTTQDITIVATDTKKKTTKELLRDARRQEECMTSATVAKSSGTTWPGLPAGELTVEKTNVAKKLLPGVKTVKTTDVHQAVVSFRDQVYQDYLLKFRAQVLQIERSRQNQLDTVNRWREKWLQSVVSVTQLY